MKLARRSSKTASILPAAMMSSAVLAMLAAASLYRVTPRLATTYHSASWADALLAAESGADMALKAMNDSVVDPNTAWAKWTPNDASTFPKTWVPTIAPHGGDGNTKLYTKITVDNAITDASGAKWMRVRSMGVAELPSSSRTGIEGGTRDLSGGKTFRSILRKERFRSDVTGGVLRLPQMVRNVEVMAAPPGKRDWLNALLVQNWYDLGSSSVVDSFDSSDPTKSTDGFYDVYKRQSHGNIATNSTGGSSDLRNAEIFGDASSNGGAIENTGGVKGSVYNNFSTTIAPVDKPTWTTFNVLPLSVSDPAAPVLLAGGTKAVPQNYKLTELSVKNARGPLIFVPHAPGEESYVNVWVTGKLSVTAQGWIAQLKGVHVKIYVEDDINLSAGGYVNQNGLASMFELRGVTPASGTRTATFTAGSNFIGIINAPSFDLRFSGNADFFGAIVGSTATFSGNGALHYDEALSGYSSNGNPNYVFVSWIEDIR